MISKFDGVGEEFWLKFLLFDEEFIIVNIDGFNYSFIVLLYKVLVMLEDDIFISIWVEDIGLDVIWFVMIKMDNDGNVVWGKLLVEFNFLYVLYFVCWDDNLSIIVDNYYVLVF